MKKILFVTSSLNAGGVESLTSTMSKYLIKNQCIVELYNIMGGKDQLEYLYENVVIHKGTRKSRMNLSFIKELRSTIRKTKPDYIICQSKFSYISTKIAAGFLKIKVIYVLQYTYNQTIIPKVLELLSVAFLKLSNDLIVTTYSKQKDSFVNRFHLPEKRFEIIPNGIDTEFYRNENNAIEGKDTFRILHVARYHKEKDQITLLRALVHLNKTYKDWELHFLGKIPSEIKSEFENYLKENNIIHKIKFYDFIEDTRDLYNKADVFVLSSISEAFPMTVLEALSSGLPCILTDVGGCSDIVQDDYNGFLFPVKCPEVLAFKIKQLATDRELLTKMRFNARETAIKRYSIDEVIKNYLKIVTTQ